VVGNFGTEQLTAQTRRALSRAFFSTPAGAFTRLNLGALLVK
jgi:hypothetical protein